MDGYFVTPDAPALKEDWWTTWLDSIRAKWPPGRYVPTGHTHGVQQAEWRPFEGVYAP